VLKTKSGFLEKTMFGGQPLMWDEAATVVPTDGVRKRMGSAKKFRIQYGDLTCPVPGNMAKDEHILRVAPCWAEDRPFCVRIKVTVKADTSKDKKSPLVLGWSEVMEPKIKLKKSITKAKERREKKCTPDGIKKCEASKEKFQKKNKKKGWCKPFFRGMECTGRIATNKIVSNADRIIREAVQELRFAIASSGEKPPKEEELGEDVGRRGGGAAITSTFTISSGSNTAGNDEALLGEDEALGRRGGVPATSSAFALSSGSNTAGNDESLQ
jgi:hypothetical protein